MGDEPVTSRPPSPPARRRRTRWAVRWSDRAARLVITLGGVGTILAVCGVAVFLIVIAAPIFFPASIRLSRSVRTPVPMDELVHFCVDEEKLLGLAVMRSGVLRVVHLTDGETLLERSLLPDDRRPTAISISERRGTLVLGLEDGSIRLGEMGFRNLFPDDDDPEYKSFADLAPGEHRARGGGLIARMPSGGLRATEFHLELSPPAPTGDDSPVAAIDHVETPSGVATLTLSADRRLALHRVRERVSRIDGTSTVVRTSTLIAEGGDLPRDVAYIRLAAQGTQAYVAARSGEIRRFSLSDPGKPRLAEVVPPWDDSLEVVACEWAKGRETLIVAASTGEVRGGFLTPAASDGSADGQSFQFAHMYRPVGGAPIALAASGGERCFALVDSEGAIEVYQVTTAQKIVSHRLAAALPKARIAFTPRTDGLIAATPDRLDLMDLDVGYPEASLAALFLPVWYEGYPGPQHVWQSSSDGEPKFGLVPLVFGTIKATVYSMLIAAPLALFAALYTSEFLRPGVKARIKPTIELMASLPSVVLGFMAAFVLAPFVADRLMQVLCMFVAIPWTFLFAGHLCQLLPTSLRLRLVPYRFWLVLCALPAGAGLAAVVAGPVERFFFAGDVFAWLDGRAGSGASGWMFLLLPACALASTWAASHWLDPLVRARLAHASHARAASVALARFCAESFAVVAAAYLLAHAINAAGWDPRGSFLGTYDQRNALVVGFVMGFAVIPIIYTIADDALSTVPEHLRSASLGAGATTWQTATWIVLPAAMSGVFSAVMVGLGRAVGETMIVLMAAGGTPILDWNPFNGFKTLSVNIANELPESAVGSVHYRILFFSAVVLFLLTSVLNTLAEAVRIRFRRRAFQL